VSRSISRLSFLFASLAEFLVAAEVQSRARRFCAAKRTLDGFSAATVQSRSEAKRDNLSLFRSCVSRLSAAGRFLKADSKTQAMILLRCLRDFLLTGSCMLRADTRRVGGLL
jgi:hypothetical protein